MHTLLFTLFSCFFSCHYTFPSIGGRQLTNLRFADDIDLQAAKQNFRQLVSRLEIASKDYGMEISGGKTKLMTNNNNGMTTDVQIAGNTLVEAQSFKYLGAIIGEEGSKSQVLTSIAQVTAALSSLKIVWRDRKITLCSNYAVYAVLCYLSVNRPKTVHKSVKFRAFRKIPVPAYQNDVKVVLNNQSKTPDNINDLIDYYNSTLQDLTDKYAPLQCKQIALRPYSPWYTSTLRREKRARRRDEGAQER